MPLWARRNQRGDVVSPHRPDEYYDAAETTPPAKMEANRLALLGQAVRHARELPFYREHWSAAGLDLSVIEGNDDFSSLPMVRKRDLIEAIAGRHSADIGLDAPGGPTPSNIVLTSGTGGFHTFAALTDDNLDGPGLLAQLRELWAMRVRPGMRVLSLSPAWHALGLFESRALTELGAVPVLPWGTLTPRFVAGMFEAIQSLDVEHLLVTARAARMLLAECDRRGLDPRRAFASVRYVGCAGEPLSPVFRSYLVERFDLDDLFERGGSGDGMFGGSECHAHRGHHIAADVHYVEILDEDGRQLAPGERGSAVVTNLGLGRSLYVRFDTEDVAAVIPGPCPCGRTHPVIEFYGRREDSVRIGSTLITPADVRTALDELEPTRFRPFSLLGSEKGVRIAIAGLETTSPSGLTEAENAISERLDVETRLEPSGVGVATWKEERVSRRDNGT